MRTTGTEDPWISKESDEAFHTMMSDLLPKWEKEVLYATYGIGKYEKPMNATEIANEFKGKWLKGDGTPYTHWSMIYIKIPQSLRMAKERLRRLMATPEEREFHTTMRDYGSAIKKTESVKAVAPLTLRGMTGRLEGSIPGEYASTTHIAIGKHVERATRSKNPEFVREVTNHVDGIITGRIGLGRVYQMIDKKHIDAVQKTLDRLGVDRPVKDMWENEKAKIEGKGIFALPGVEKKSLVQVVRL